MSTAFQRSQQAQARGRATLARCAAALGAAVGLSACGGALPGMAGSGVRAWYLPLGVMLLLLRAGAPQKSRRALELALFLLGLSALVTRAVQARSSPETRAREHAEASLR